MKYYTYILQSEKDGNLYIGHRKDINVRIRKHNSKNITSTKNRRLFKFND